MRDIKLYRLVRPYLSAVATVATSAALVFAIYFTEIGPQWTTFLAGLLVASILAEASRVSRSEWLLTRRTAQLAAMKDKLEHLMLQHRQGEENLAAAQSRLHLMDEDLSVMIALIDSEGRCRYHNHAFRNWLHLRSEQINDRLLREILGSKVYADMAILIRQSLDGQAVRYERTHTMPNGAVYRLSMEHVPQLDGKGKVTGFYMLADDLTGRGDLTAPVAGAAQDSQPEQDLFIDTLSEQVTGRKDAGRRMFSAIENGEFSLYCQLIAPLNPGSGESEHYEILIRLNEEEQNLMPPGAFFPLAEKHGLMPYLDRWVVRHVMQQATTRKQHGLQQQSPTYFINVASSTLCDPEFPVFLAEMLQEHGVAGSTLCFEVPDREFALANAAVAEFVRRINACGCRIALCGFGRDGVSFSSIRGFRVEYLKIDGGVILEVLRDPVELAKVAAIARVAKKIGVKTIAEMVESDETIARLRGAGVDFAQGFAISHPRSLGE